MNVHKLNIEVLKHRRACDLCLKDKCNKKCEHAKGYSFREIQRAYDAAIEFMETRPVTCQSCGRGCFDIDKFCPHCGKRIKGNDLL